MPARKSNASVASNGAEDVVETTAARTPKDGISIEDLSLPKSMIARLAKGVLPANTQIHKDALLALHKSATVFVSYIASNSNENAQSSGKKTISPQDVMAAIKDAEFEDFLPRLEAELKKYNETQCDKRNTYRRKVKEEKAAAAAKDDDEAPKEDDAAEKANGATNGHVEGEDEDRPTKKLKAENGTARAPHANDIDDDEMDVEQDDADDHLNEGNPDDEDEDDEVGEDDDEEEDVTEPVVLVDADNVALGGDIRDEALDDPESDSD